MSDLVQSVEELAPTTQIAIFPDGRVHVHGITREVVELLQGLDPRNELFERLIPQDEESENG